MKSICGASCESCDLRKVNKCVGCNESKGCPFGKKCFIYNYIDVGGMESFEEFKSIMIKEINELIIPGMPKIDNLYCLQGSFVNLEYPINGKKIQLLDDADIYLGTQVECEFNENVMKRCFGVVCNPSFILVSEYGENGDTPELITYIKR